MPHATTSSNRTRHAWNLLPCAIATLVLTSMQSVSAGEARKGVKAAHGEIVVLRTVPTRIATRQQPPGTALLIDPRPNHELKSVLGKGSELSDAEIAMLSASPVQTTVRHLGSTLTQILGAPSTGAARQVSPNNAAPGAHPMSAIVSATSGLGNTMQQAMGAIPTPTGSR